MSVDSRLDQIVSSVFLTDVALKDTDSPATVEDWDSVGHLRLMLAIEQEFGIEISPDTMAVLNTMGAIRQHLTEAVRD